MENNVDLAEITIKTPIPKSPIRNTLKEENRILSNNWIDYTCDKAVFLPKNMSVEKLEELNDYAWDTFYSNGGYQTKMGELFFKIIKKEILDGTYKRYNPKKNRSFKKELV